MTHAPSTYFDVYKVIISGVYTKTRQYDTHTSYTGIAVFVCLSYTALMTTLYRSKHVEGA
jgi:hypothetical protein